MNRFMSLLFANVFYISLDSCDTTRSSELISNWAYFEMQLSICIRRDSKLYVIDISKRNVFVSAKHDFLYKIYFFEQKYLYIRQTLITINFYLLFWIEA